ERRLMIFFAARARDLAREAARQTADPTRSREARAAIGARFLEAIWRYYNLVDFAVAQRDDTTSVAIRLAFDEATGYARSAAAPDRLREPLTRMAHVLSILIESSTPARRAHEAHHLCGRARDGRRARLGRDTRRLPAEGREDRRSRLQG